ncbi:MAG TPA: DUF2505 domain-containing protein [Nannocystis sp.]
MATFRITHEINCNAETFWKLFFDPEFNTKMFKEALAFPEFEVLEFRETDATIVRKVRAMPKLNVPGPVAKLLGSGFRYTEEGTFDKATQKWRWKMIPSALADKLRQEGTMWLEPIGDDKIRRVAELITEAKVFGIGGLIESSAEKQMREGWDASAVFFNKQLAARAAS